LRRWKRKNKGMDKGKGKDKDKENKIEEANFKKENYALKDELKRLQRKVEGVGVGVGGGTGVVGRAGGLEGISDDALREQVSEQERRVAELVTKNVMITEELNNYKMYMETTVKKYKKAIKDLKSQIV